MISNATYSIKHINEIKRKYNKLDPQVIERTIFAFGLLEALVKVGTPFIFKGGTCLMLILENPYRLSTDIDIMVNPDCDIDPYLNEAAKIYPFKSREEQIRIGKNGIVKRHFKFYYDSLYSEIELSILLDVLYEKNNYHKTISKEIKMEFLITEGDNLKVVTPSAESILGDKLTAFAPNTTGIEYYEIDKNGEKIDKTIQVIKQFFDCAQLVKEVENFKEVLETYKNIHKLEKEYRGIDKSFEECLMDTFNASLSIYTRGKIFPDQYKYLLSGIQKIQNHIYGINFNSITAHKNACDVMLICAILLKDIESIDIEEQRIFRNKKLGPVNKMRKIDQQSFNKAATAIRLLEIDK